jgi:hypothetical protein
MRHLNIVLFAILISLFICSIGYSQNFSASNNNRYTVSPQSPDSLLEIHYDGANNGNSISDSTTTFIGGAKFRDSIMSIYTGGELQYVRFFYAQAATGLAIKIFDAGTDTSAGTELLSQTLELDSLTVGNWNEVELSSYLPISGNDLWVCLQVEDSTGLNYPFGVDEGPADPDGDWVNDTGVWQHLSDFGLNYNWNIRAIVETIPNAVELGINDPVSFNLEQNFPNPFNPTTNINFSIPKQGQVKLAIYNLIGQKVAALVNEVLNAGRHQVTFNAASLPSGVYFYRLQAGNSVMIKKMLFLK